MDISHIKSILNEFKESHVSLTIKANSFEETCIDNKYHQEKSKDVYEGLDDMLKECRKYAKIENTRSTQEVQIDKVTKFFYMLCCIKESTLTLKRYTIMDKPKLLQFKQDILKFIEETQVKNLEITKYKLTKKALRELLARCLANSDDTWFDWSCIRSLLVITVRLLRKPIIYQENGITKENFTLPTSIENTNESIIIDYKNSDFILL
jgi:hypothetical protein